MPARRSLGDLRTDSRPDWPRSRFVRWLLVCGVSALTAARAGDLDTFASDQAV